MGIKMLFTILFVLVLFLAPQRKLISVILVCPLTTRIVFVWGSRH